MNCDGPGIALAYAQILPEQGQVLHRINGADVWVHYRVLLYLADLEEKWKILAVKPTSCVRCEGLTNARKDTRKDEWEYLTGDPAHVCGTAPPRTPANVMRWQMQLALCSRVKGLKTSTDEIAKTLGVFYDVETTLLRHSHLFGGSSVEGGVYGSFVPDFLHVVGLGVFRVFLKMLDYLCAKHRNISEYASTEDVRHAIEETLAAIPPMKTAEHRLLTFKVGPPSPQLALPTAHWAALTHAGWLVVGGTRTGVQYVAMLCACTLLPWFTPVPGTQATTTVRSSPSRCLRTSTMPTS